MKSKKILAPVLGMLRRSRSRIGGFAVIVVLAWWALLLPGCDAEFIPPTGTGVTKTLAGSSNAFGNGVGTAATFKGPFDVALSRDLAILYVSDDYANRVRKVVLATQDVSTFAGSGSITFSDGTGSSAGFNGPRGLAVSYDDQFLFVADYNHNRVRKITMATQSVTTVVGSGVASSIDGTGTGSTFNGPVGVAITSDDSVLYVSDFWVNRIRKVVLSTRVVTTFAGSAQGYANGIGAAANFYWPTGITLTSDDQMLFVADLANGRVRQIVVATRAVSDLAAFYQPRSVKVSGDGVVYVSDTAHLISKVVVASQTASTLAGSGAFAFADGVGVAASFFNPSGLALPADGTVVYVADTNNFRVRAVGTGLIACAAGRFSESGACMSCPPGKTSNAGASSCFALFIPPTASGEAMTLAGSSGAFGNDIGTAASFSFPRDVAFSGDFKTLFVADASNNRIRKVVVGAQEVFTVAGSGTAAFADGSGAGASFSGPWGVVLTMDNEVLFVADYDNNRVRKIIVATEVVTTVVGSGVASSVDGTGAGATVNQPAGVVLTSDDSVLYVTEFGGNRIRKIVLSTLVMTTLAGSAQGFANGIGAAANFFRPAGITLTSDDQVLFVADLSNNRVRQIVVATRAVSVLAGTGTLATTNGVGTSASIYQPRSVVVSSDRAVVYVSDSANYIRKIVLATQAVSVLAGSGSPTFADGLGAACSDTANSIMVAATGYNCVQLNGLGQCATQLCPACPYPHYCDISCGFPCLSESGPSFFSPSGLALPADGTTVYVADTMNNRIRAVGTGMITCAAGKFSESGACSSCPAGWYSAAAGASTCTMCSAGRFQAATAATSCENCDAGTFNDITGRASACTRTCAAGTYSAAGASSCSSCAAGRYQTATGASACTDCEAGSFCATTGLSTVTGACVMGQYQSSTGSTTCIDCAAGTYNALSGATACSNPCAAGTYSPAGASACTSCDSGKFSALGALTCTNCLAGTFAASTGSADSCQNCPAGSFCATTGLSAVTGACATGKFSSVGALICTTCLPGYYQPNSGGTSCIACTEGKFSNDQRDSCDQCPSGTFVTNQTCLACPFGEYALFPQPDSCQGCAEGFMTNSATGATQCNICNSGTYSPGHTDSCLSCVSGTYSGAAASSCLACTAGKFAAVSGQGSCSDCAAGTTSAEGAKSCTACPAGSAQGAPGQTSCILCKAGTFAAEVSSKTCSDCPGNEHSTLGATTCDQCDKNYYRRGSVCRECPDNAFCAGDLLLPAPVKGYWSNRAVRGNMGESVYKCLRATCTGVVVSETSNEPREKQCWTVDSAAATTTATTTAAPCVYDSGHDSLLCELGSHGPLCGSCLTEYYYSALSNACEQCTGAWGNTLFVVAGVCVAVGMAGLVASGRMSIPSVMRSSWAGLVARLNGGQAPVVESDWLTTKRRPVAGSDGFKALPAPVVSQNSSSDDIDYPESFCGGGLGVRVIVSTFQIAKSIVSTLAGSAANMDSGSLKVIFSTYQIVQSITVTLDVDFPPLFANFLSFLSVFSFNVSTLECSPWGDVYSSVFFTSAVPVVCATIIVLSGQCRKALTSSSKHRSRVDAQTAWALLLLSYMVLPPVTTKQLQALNCIELPNNGGRSYLRQDTSIDCNSKSHREFARINSALIGVYVFIPIAWIVLLNYVKPHLLPNGAKDEAQVILMRAEDDKLSSVRFLYKDYRPSLFYFEAVEMYRRILFCSVIAVSTTSTLKRGLVGCLLSLASMVAYREVMPFQLTFASNLAHISQIVIFLTFGAAVIIENGVGDDYPQLAFGIVLCAINVVVVGVAVVASLSRHRRMQLEIRRKQEARVVKLEWAVGFMANKFNSTFAALLANSVPASHTLVFYYSSTVEISGVLRCGLPTTKNLQGILVALHRPHDLTDEEKAAFPCREAFVVCSLPKRLLCAAPGFDLKGESSSALRLIPNNVLEAIRGSYFGDLINPTPWVEGHILLPPQCIKRAYQLEQSGKKEHSQWSNGINLASKSVSAGDVETDLDDEDKWDAVDHLTTPASCTDFADAMARVRLHCKRRNLLPLFHYTTPSVAPIILKGGLRMSTQGQGDGGVYFSTLGPASYGLGSPEYEENIISDCFGKERLDEYRGKGLLDVCLVYGADPMVLSQAPGGRDNAKMVSKGTFEDLSLPRANGNYFLRSDRIMAAWLLNPARAPPGLREAADLLDKEVENDARTKDELAVHEKQLAENEQLAQSVYASATTKVEWAVGFSANKFNTTFESVIASSVPPSHTLVFYYSSLAGITKALRSGIEAESIHGGVLFTVHQYHDLTGEDKAVFPCRDAFVACSLPTSLLCTISPTKSTLLLLPSRVLGAMRGSYFGGVVDPGPWIDERVLLPPQCIKRAFQLEQGPSAQAIITKGNSSGILARLQDVPLEHREPVSVQDPKTCAAWLAKMAEARAVCKANEWVTLYHYTALSVAPIIVKGGFRMSTQGQGDGGVYFSTLGPASYGLGSPEYEKNIISDCFGKERLDEYRGKGLLDVCLVYGADPLILHQAPGGRDNAKVVSKGTFECLSLANANGNYFLRPDRILAAFLINPKSPPSGKEGLLRELEAENKRDVETKEFLGSPDQIFVSRPMLLGLAPAEEVEVTNSSKSSRDSGRGSGSEIEMTSVIQARAVVGRGSGGVGGSGDTSEPSDATKPISPVASTLKPCGTVPDVVPGTGASGATGGASGASDALTLLLKACGGLDVYAPALVALGCTEVEALCDKEHLSDSTLMSVIGMYKFEVRKLRSHVQRATMQTGQTGDPSRSRLPMKSRTISGDAVDGAVYTGSLL